MKIQGDTHWGLEDGLGDGKNWGGGVPTLIYATRRGDY